MWVEQCDCSYKCVPLLFSELLHPEGRPKIEERWSLVREQRLCMNKLLPAFFVSKDKSVRFNSFHIGMHPYTDDSYLRILEAHGFLKRHILAENM